MYGKAFTFEKKVIGKFRKVFIFEKVSSLEVDISIV